MNTAKRIVITGMGTVNPLGNSVQESWDAVLKGKSGIGPITRFDASNCSSRVAGEVKDFDWKSYYSEDWLKTAKRLDRFVHYAAAGMKEALEQSGLDIARDPEKVGICIGSGLGGVKVQHDNSAALISGGGRRVSPFYIPGAIGNIASGFMSMVHGIKGPNLSTQTACATANHSIGVALLMIRAGMADAFITGGTEGVLEEIIVNGFCNMRAMATNYNDEPEKASRPYDIDRDGFVIAEGSGILILEEYEAAKNRGADIICEVLSVGMSGDAHDLVIPDPEGRGAFYSMRMALDQAGLPNEKLNYINAHGTATPLGDIAETTAIRTLIRGKEDHLSVGSTKSMHGHLLGAAAGIEAIISAKAVQEDIVPGTINIDSQDPKVPLSCIPKEAQERTVNYALSNSFGFGGHNSSLVLGKI